MGFSRMTIKSLVVVIIAVFVTLQSATTALAADARNYNAGRIIDDGIFTNSNAMTAANIQSFFNSKAVCDTYGTKTSELGGGTRAQWLAAHGISTPITCLRDYYENVTTGANNYGKGIPAGAISAAQIVYNYSQQFSINPQVLIVTLQKENGLITDEWPTPKQYSEALGFGCPDNVAPGAPACNPAYGSFSAQVYQAARHFRGFINDTPGWYVPFDTGTNSVRFSPDSNCGSGNVNIVNRSTVALYSYTPYQPNQAALNAQYGGGDGCSAHGNRNFYLYFTDWFGSVYGGDPVSTSVRLTSPITTNPVNPVAGQTVTVSYTVKNFGSTDVNYESSILQCRLNTVANCDSAASGPGLIAAGASATLTNTITVQHGGNYNLVPFFFYGGLWSRYGVESPVQNIKSLVTPNIPLTTAISVLPSQPTVGQPLTVTYIVRNNGTQSVVYQDAVLQCRDEASNNCDSATTGPLTLAVGESRTFTQTVVPNTDGAYVLTPYFLMNNVWYTYIASQPAITVDVPDVRLTGDITVSPTTPIPGQDITVDYTIKNFGTKTINYASVLLQCRFNSNSTCDPSPEPSSSIVGGASKSFSVTIPASQAGSFRLLPYFLYNNRWFEVKKGVASSNVKTVEVPRYVADVRIEGSIDVSPAQPIPGDPVVISYTVKNYGTLPAIFQTSLLQCRFSNGSNCDSSYTGTITLNPDATHIFNYTITPSARQGTYKVVPYFMQNNDWHMYGFSAGNANMKNVIVPNYTPDLRLTGDISLSPVNPTSGQTVTVSYSLKNFGTRTINYDTSVLQCRRNTTVNCDPTSDSDDSLDPGETKTFSTQLSSAQSGSYRLLPYYLYGGQWSEFGKGIASSSTKLFTIN
jgi:hypothetical protein